MLQQWNKHRGFVKSIAIFALIIFLLDSTASFAKTKSKRTVSSDESGYVTERRKDGTIIKYKKKNTYDFEGSKIEGLYNKPSGSYISNIKDVKARTIIRIRKHFDDEVVDTARMIQ